MKTALKIAIGVSVIGAVVLIVSAVLGFSVLPDYIKKKTEDEVALRPFSDTWNKWANIDKPLFSDFHVLSVTNPDEVENGAFPKFMQKGPFSYRQRRRKVNITQPEGPRSVTYEQETWYYFDEANSKGNTEDDLVNVFNVPYYLFLLGLNQIDSQYVPIFEALLKQDFGETLIRRDVRIRELLFEGMSVQNYVDLLTRFGAPVPDDFAAGPIGLYTGRNGSADGIYKIHTGVDDIDSFGQIMEWNGKNYLGFWNHMSLCDRVNGSDGTIFPPFVEKGRIVDIFSSDIYRSLILKYESEVKVHDIKGYKFILPKEVLEDPRVNPDNKCFCNETIAECLYGGAIDVSSIRKQPLAFSTPHFLDGALKYRQDTSLSPRKEVHETALVIEPNSGALLKANKRIQLNVNFRPLPNAPEMMKSPSVMFPVMWVDENTEFTNENAEELKDKLLRPKKAVEVWRWVGVGIGIALILGAGVIYVVKG